MKSESSANTISFEEATECLAIDYFSRKVLLGSTSGKISLQNLTPEGAIASTSVIHAHESPVISLDWAHPSIGDIFVSAEQAGIVRVWFRRNTAEGYMTVFEKKLEAQRFPPPFDLILIVSFVSLYHIIATCVRFAPPEYGCKFAISSTDGQIYILKRGIFIFIILLFL